MAAKHNGSITPATLDLALVGRDWPGYCILHMWLCLANCSLVANYLLNKVPRLCHIAVTQAH